MNNNARKPISFKINTDFVDVLEYSIMCILQKIQAFFKKGTYFELFEHACIYI